MINLANAAYHTDHAAAMEEINALAALLADVVVYTTGGFYPGRLADVAEVARRYESVRRQLVD